MIEITTVKIPNHTAFPIVATIRKPLNHQGVILFNAGTCIIRSFYDHIATFFCEQGYVTIQYDYVGVGDSRPSDLRKVDHSIYDWGRYDIEVMSQYIDEVYGDELPKYIIAHSMGGQILGLVPSLSSFAKIITLASSYGNYRNFGFKDKMRSMLFSKTIFMWMTRWYGYLPGKMIGIGIDWPKGVCEDWVLWNSRYLSFREWMDREGKAHYFDAPMPPMSSYIFTDDIMATPKCIPHFQKDYPHASIQIVAPSDYGVEGLGHFKTFKPAAEPLWKDLLIDLQQG